MPLAMYTEPARDPAAHHRRGAEKAGPKDQAWVVGSKTSGRGRAGKRSGVEAASRTRQEAEDTDWMGKRRERNDGWHSRRRRSEGGGGRDRQADETGS